MIHFYILTFLAFALIVAAILFACIAKPTWNSLYWMIMTMIAFGVVMFGFTLFAATEHSGYSYFDPSICVQVVYDQDERKWVCVTWEEAG